MGRVLFFNALQLLVSGYAIWRGGAPERVAGVALLSAAFATFMMESDFATVYVGIEYSVLVVDLVLLAILMVLALYADRYWTMWIAAMHALGTTGHLIKATGIEHLRVVYAIQTTIWSYPIVIVLLIATARHVRRVKRLGRQVDWSFQDPTLRREPFGNNNERNPLVSLPAGRERRDRA
jgi:hypothetical protein